MPEFKSRDLTTPLKLLMCYCTGLNSDATLLWLFYWCLHDTPRYFKEYYGILTHAHAINFALVLLFVKTVRYAV